MLFACVLAATSLFKDLIRANKLNKVFHSAFLLKNVNPYNHYSSTIDLNKSIDSAAKIEQHTFTSLNCTQLH